MGVTSVERFIPDFVNAIRDESAAVFAGAGLSIPAGLVDWRGLMRDIASDLRLDVDKETDLVSLAQFHVNERGGRHRINEALVTEFAERGQLSQNHHLLASLPIRTYWTTNYDTLIEQALRAAQKRVDVKHSDPNLAYCLRQRDAVLYKMHGDVSQPDEAVVTRDDYEMYGAKRPLMGLALQGDLVSKTFLFLGFSFSDPNLAHILGRIRVLLGAHRRDHYCLLRRVHEQDFEQKDAYEYASVRQELQTKDLQRYGIQSVMLDSYDEYTNVLTQLSQHVRRRRVFVAGSAATFEPFSDAEGQQLVRQVGRGLIESGFDIVNGFGLGVGPFLLNGALEGLGETGTRTLNDRLILRPFPQGITDPTERATRWRAYRQSMIDHAGIAVFLFGNKLSEEKVVVSDGVMEEFELAEATGLVIVPLGGTGYAAAQIYQTVTEQPEKYFAGRPELQERLQTLGARDNIDALAARVLDFVNAILKGN
jgi:hypothetical protein